MTQDLKVYLTNAGALSISLTDIDAILKIALLLVSRGYTIQRWYLMNKKSNENNKEL